MFKGDGHTWILVNCWDCLPNRDPLCSLKPSSILLLCARSGKYIHIYQGSLVWLISELVPSWGFITISPSSIVHAIHYLSLLPQYTPLPDEVLALQMRQRDASDSPPIVHAFLWLSVNKQNKPLGCLTVLRVLWWKANKESKEENLGHSWNISWDWALLCHIQSLACEVYCNETQQFLYFIGIPERGLRALAVNPELPWVC